MSVILISKALRHGTTC